MSLSCTATNDDYYPEQWCDPPKDESPLNTKRGRDCCSCGKRIRVGDLSRVIRRRRRPTAFEDFKGIYNDEEGAPMPNWYLCEVCGDLAESLGELGFCYEIGTGESLQQQIAEYRADMMPRMREKRNG